MRKSPRPSCPSYVIRLLKYQSQHFTLYTSFRAGVAPILTLLLCLDEVIKDARAISGASRPDEQAENRQTPGAAPLHPLCTRAPPGKSA
uniref:Uncharacterized protein n=1 Tax=Vespula pensylvanica TaxID=30213 RepID=A0A834PGG6_VESPE|nr:hypothetical protein H0235_001739 [Vespula pensylvanica]